MSASDILRPVRCFAYFFIGIGMLGIAMHIYLTSDVRYTNDFKIFVLALSGLHILLGFGILIRSKWAFYVFRSYVLLLYLGFPIGTYISRRMQAYFETHNIKRYFE